MVRRGVSAGTTAVRSSSIRDRRTAMTNDESQREGRTDTDEDKANAAEKEGVASEPDRTGMTEGRPEDDSTAPTPSG
jgi:hypothetical protein